MAGNTYKKDIHKDTNFFVKSYQRKNSKKGGGWGWGEFFLFILNKGAMTVNENMLCGILNKRKCLN